MSILFIPRGSFYFVCLSCSHSSSIFFVHWPSPLILWVRRNSCLYYVPLVSGSVYGEYTSRVLSITFHKLLSHRKCRELKGTRYNIFVSSSLCTFVFSPPAWELPNAYLYPYSTRSHSLLTKKMWLNIFHKLIFSNSIQSKVIHLRIK